MIRQKISFSNFNFFRNKMQQKKAAIIKLKPSLKKVLSDHPDLINYIDILPNLTNIIFRQSRIPETHRQQYAKLYRQAILPPKPPMPPKPPKRPMPPKAPMPPKPPIMPYQPPKKNYITKIQKIKMKQEDVDVVQVIPEFQMHNFAKDLWLLSPIAPKTMNRIFRDIEN
jgi:hypothetical protein